MMIQQQLKQLLIKLLQPILIVQQFIIVGRKIQVAVRLILDMETAMDVGFLEVNLTI